MAVYAQQPIKPGEEVCYDYCCRSDDIKEVNLVDCLWYITIQCTCHATCTYIHTVVPVLSFSSGARTCNGTLMHLSEDAVLESFAKEKMTFAHRFALLARAAMPQLLSELPTAVSSGNHAATTAADVAPMDTTDASSDSLTASLDHSGRVPRTVSPVLDRYRQTYERLVASLPAALRSALQRNQVKWYQRVNTFSSSHTSLMYLASLMHVIS